MHIEDKKNLALVGKLGATHKQHMLCKNKNSNVCSENMNE
jgi:hypothetical protein